MKSKSVLLLLAGLIAACVALFFYWLFWTNSTVEKATPNQNPEEVVKIHTKVDTTHTAVDKEYIAKLKTALSDKNVRQLEIKTNQMSKKEDVDAAKLSERKDNLVQILARQQIIDRYNQEVPTPTEPIYLMMRNQDFYLALFSYYDKHSNELLDGGIELKGTMNAIFERDDPVNMLDAIKIQSIYSKNQEATVDNVNTGNVNGDVFEVLLAYYQEVDQLDQNDTALDLKGLINQAVDKEVISVADFNEIQRMYRSLKKNDALIKLNKIANE